jgi:tRNA1Val (adenine37-N6)-methyltransferase
MDTDLTLFLNGTLRVHQPRKGYRFNVDSVLLAGFARCLEGERVLDLGCGAGILLLLLKAHYHPGPLTGVEIQPQFAELAARNLTENGFDDEAQVIEGDLRDGARLPESGFDLIVSNPPFYASGRVMASPDARKATARDDRTFTLEDLAACAARSLAPSGRLCFILPAEREGEALAALAQGGLVPAILRRVRNRPDAPDHRVMIQARAHWDGAPLELPPLPLRLDADTYSDEVRLLLRQVEPRGPRFFCDAMVGTLARYLRLLGADAAYRRGAPDAWLAQECRRSGRVLLTRDRELLRLFEAGALPERAPRWGRGVHAAMESPPGPLFVKEGEQEKSPPGPLFVKEGEQEESPPGPSLEGGESVAALNPDDDRPAKQLEILRAAFPGLGAGTPGRCLGCNAEVLPIPRQIARGRVPPYTWLTRERFHACPSCGKLTWEGSHLERFAKAVRREG